MRRFAAAACLPIALSILGVSGIRAQAAHPIAFPGSDDSVPEVTGAAPGHSLARRIGTALAGAVVGAGVGYFASQVALGDWDELSGRHRISRTTWAAIGGGAGMTLGFSFPLGGGGSGSPGGAHLVLPSGRAVITAGEIVGSGASSAYDLVRNLRPEWLNRRLAHAWDTKEEADIRVYLDTQLLGGLDALSSIAAQNVQAIYRYDAAAASIRWGAGHQEGAILVVTKG
jgi:hypothetical protein